MSVKTITPDGTYTAETEPGFYTIQLAQSLTGAETITATGGGQTFHTFDATSVDDLSGITIWYVLEEMVLTAANNAGDLDIAFERVVFT
jgi:hypothetical protein